MTRRTLFLFGLWLAAFLAGGTLRAQERAAAAHPLVWDAMEKTYLAKPEERSAAFTFTVKNTSSRPMQIYYVRPSCGCTVTKLPRDPWVLAPGETSSFTGTVDFEGKHGKLAKMLYVGSVPGTQTLTLLLDVPLPDPKIGAANQQLALANRQAVFRGECASCHAAPTKGLMGRELFSAACGVCHSADPRASMVPDLEVALVKRDEAYWLKWISEGKEGTLMPGFSAKQGGPLTDEQIASLVEYTTRFLPNEP